MKVTSLVGWGIVNQCCNIFIPFLVIFLSYKYINVEIASVWVIFLSMISLVLLFDFGLSPAIVRNVSYVISGAKNLVKTGVEGIIIGDKISYSLLSRLILDIKKIYACISIIALFVVGVGGGGYFYYISPADSKQIILLSWAVFSGGLIVSFIYLYYTPVLTGLGDIKSSYKANIIGRISWLFFSLFAIYVYPSLLSLSLSFLFSVLTNRYVCSYFFKKNEYIQRTNKSYASNENSTIPFIGYNASKLGIVSLGGFLINRATSLIVGLVCPIVTAGQFVLTMQVFFALMSVSNVLLSIKIPDISRSVARNSYNEIRKLILEIFGFSTMIYLIGFLFVVVLSGFVFPLLNINLSLLPQNYILILGFIYFLEMNHTICATIITTKNHVPFLSSSLISGAGIVILSIVFTFYYEYGVIGLILAQGGVQLIYNNWKWPVVMFNLFIKK
ncbi:O-unit flippase-like protein [Yersinia sp. IP36721]|uniref:O-unit flippase-like protein n=1 Tax=Yersinia sp. IP36721 TaxID=2161716 RepID=UPI000EB2A6FA|nr:O-unit flippase-like protein [Yersinia sp. IP36721]